MRWRGYVHAARRPRPPARCGGRPSRVAVLSPACTTIAERPSRLSGASPLAVAATAVDARCRSPSLLPAHAAPVLRANSPLDARHRAAATPACDDGSAARLCAGAQIRALPGVTDVRRVHVWAHNGALVVATACVHVADAAATQSVLHSATRIFGERTMGDVCVQVELDETAAPAMAIGSPGPGPLSVAKRVGSARRAISDAAAVDEHVGGSAAVRVI